MHNCQELIQYSVIIAELFEHLARVVHESENALFLNYCMYLNSAKWYTRNALIIGGKTKICVIFESLNHRILSSVQYRKTCVKWQLKIDKTNILMTNGLICLI